MEKIIYLIICGDFYIYTIIDDFLKYNPPCKECLVQPACLEGISLYKSGKEKKFFCSHTSVCEKLKEFLENNYLFEKIDINKI